MISAMEEQEVGWPELLAVVILTECTLKIFSECALCSKYFDLQQPHLSLWARSCSSVCWSAADIIVIAGSGESEIIVGILFYCQRTVTLHNSSH